MWESDLGPHGVSLTFEPDRARIALRGQVDVATGSALVDAATSAVARYRCVDLDLASVTSIDELGMRSLVKVKRFADAYQTAISVVAASDVVSAALAEAGLSMQLGFLTPLGETR